MSLVKARQRALEKREQEARLVELEQRNAALEQALAAAQGRNAELEQALAGASKAASRRCECPRGTCRLVEFGRVFEGEEDAQR